MIIVNKEGTSISNFEQIENIFIGDTSVKVTYRSGNGCRLGYYNTSIEAKTALEILTERITANVECIKMPQDEEVNARVNSSTYSKARLTGGRKPQRHGGS